MTLSNEKKMAIQALVLGNRSQEDAGRFVSSMSFVFREINKIDISVKKSYKALSVLILRRESDLDEDAIHEKIFKNKPFLIKYFRGENKKAIFYQLLTLQLSGWIKGCCKIHPKTLATYSGKEPHLWLKKILEVGPRYNNLPWAQIIDVASNYVRHKEEWHFNSIELDIHTRKLKRRANIIATLEGPKPKKNARYLLNLGVTEDVLFGSFRDATSEILEITKSDTPEALKTNCEAWLKALNTYVKKELFKLI